MIWDVLLAFESFIWSVSFDFIHHPRTFSDLLLIIMNTSNKFDCNSSYSIGWHCHNVSAGI